MEISAKRKTHEVNSNADIRFFLLTLELHDSRHWFLGKRKEQKITQYNLTSSRINVNTCRFMMRDLDIKTFCL